MSDPVAEIADLDECVTHADWALWLLTEAYSVLLTSEMTIRNRLLQAGFREGLDYLDIELAAQRRRRRENGTHFNNYELDAARGRMLRILLGLPPRGL